MGSFRVQAPNPHPTPRPLSAPYSPWKKFEHLQINITMRNHLMPISMAAVKNSENDKC